MSLSADYSLGILAHEYHWSWVWFGMACVFIPLFTFGALNGGTLFDYIFGFTIASAWSVHLVRPFVLRLKLQLASKNLRQSAKSADE